MERVEEMGGDYRWHHDFPAQWFVFFGEHVFYVIFSDGKHQQ